MSTNGHTLIIGTSDGLYKATPNGKGYATKKLSLAARGDFRAAVVADHRDPSILYAGTVKSGMFRSRDAGRTWQEINTGLLHRTVWSIAQHRTTGDLYVGASPASVYVSHDRGDSWSELEALELLPETREWHGPVPPHVSRMKDIALTDDASPDIYGAIEEGWAVRSLDGGRSWQQILDDQGKVSHDGHSVKVVAGSAVVIATGKGVFRSDDRGDHFEPANRGLEERSYTSSPLSASSDGVLLCGVTAVGPGGWRRPEGGDSGIARSSDGGKTWQVSTEGLPTPCAAIPRGIDFAHDNRSLAFVGFTDGSVYTTQDGGRSFDRLLDGLPPIMSVTVA
jgi:photosystem II stability/assembly factor-like uncharacterized protein